MVTKEQGAILLSACTSFISTPYSHFKDLSLPKEILKEAGVGAGRVKRAESGEVKKTPNFGIPSKEVIPIIRFIDL